MTHPCPTCGLEHAVETAVVPDVATAAADVEIAQIEAERDIKLAKITAEAIDNEQETEIARLRGELAGLRELVERVAPPPPEPDPEPVPVVIAPPDPEPVDEPPAVEAPPPVETAPPRSSKKQNPWW